MMLRSGIIRSFPMRKDENFPSRPGQDLFQLSGVMEPAGEKYLQAFVHHLISVSGLIDG